MYANVCPSYEGVCSPYGATVTSRNVFKEIPIYPFRFLIRQSSMLAICEHHFNSSARCTCKKVMLSVHNQNIITHNTRLQIISCSSDSNKNRFDVETISLHFLHQHKGHQQKSIKLLTNENSDILLSQVRTAYRNTISNNLSSPAKRGFTIHHADIYLY